MLSFELKMLQFTNINYSVLSLNFICGRIIFLVYKIYIMIMFTLIQEKQPYYPNIPDKLESRIDNGGGRVYY